MTDDQFLQALEDCSLAPDDFNHGAHVRAAWLYLQRGEFGWALDRMRCAISRYAASLGQPDRYHETITVAFVALIQQHRRQRGDGQSWPEFAEANPELFDPALLQRFYAPELLASSLARQTFLLPTALEALSQPTRRTPTSALR